MSKSPFRKAALDKIASVDQLDRIIKVTSPLSYLALLGVTIIIAVVGVWSFTGSLPSTITAPGVLVSAETSTNTFLAPASGTVQLLVDEGMGLPSGTNVVSITQSSGVAAYPIDQNCYVTSILNKNGAAVNLNAELFRMRPYLPAGAGQSFVAVCYVPVQYIDKIQPGMPVTVTLTSAESNTYGHMEGIVVLMDRWATSSAGIQAVVGSGNMMDSAFTQNGSVCAVTCALTMDSEAASHRNEFYWSNAKGFSLALSSHMMCSVRITTEEQKPIYKLFARLKDLWGE